MSLTDRINQTKKYLTNAKELTNIVKKRYDDGERFTKFKCDDTQDPDKCKEKTLKGLNELKESFNINLNIKSVEELKENFKESCINNDELKKKDLEKKLRNLGYLVKC